MLLNSRSLHYSYPPLLRQFATNSNWGFKDPNDLSSSQSEPRVITNQQGSCGFVGGGGHLISGVDQSSLKCPDFSLHLTSLLCIP